VESPTVTIEPRKMRRRNGRRPRGRPRVWLRRLALGIVALLALPLLLSLLYLAPPVHPLSTLMIKDLAAFRGYERQWTPLEEIGPRLVNSVLMSEDGQFCSHHGIDLGEFRAVFEDFLAGEATRGGSTITMQTVKNLYLWHGRSYVRKGLELPYAIYLDLVMPKRRIMEIYLNIALLAVTLPNPLARTPGKPTKALNRLAATIERRAGHAGGYNACLK
jgi:monofunctional biosynthetic peptidoglycan transglycosylase